MTQHRDTLTWFLGIAGKYRPLTSAEEQVLAHRIQAGDEEAVEKLVLHNVRFAYRMARQFEVTGAELVDLLQDALLGMVKYARRFEPGHGKFISFAKFKMMTELQRGSAMHVAAVTAPHHALKNIKAIVSAWAALKASSGFREPDVADIAAKAGTTETDVLRCMLYMTIQDSLDAPVGEGHLDVVSRRDLLPGDSDTQAISEALDESRLAETILSGIPKREADALRMHYGLATGDGMTLEAIGRAWGLSRERVRQIRNNGLASARRHAATAYREEFKARAVSL